MGSDTRVLPLTPVNDDDFFKLRKDSSCDWCHCVAQYSIGIE